ncbi:hypothetical protein ABT061_35085 [Streptosporangium sp. NPDC002544]|uniref:hypothetical protein n=1 Tax=Streptosporangium sp. NPDC002544 TaxID=3154538 RepID=UPI003329E3F5
MKRAIADLAVSPVEGGDAIVVGVGTTAQEFARRKAERPRHRRERGRRRPHGVPVVRTRGVVYLMSGLPAGLGGVCKVERPPAPPGVPTPSGPEPCGARPGRLSLP